MAYGYPLHTLMTLDTIWISISGLTHATSLQKPIKGGGVCGKFSVVLRLPTC